MQIDSSFVRVGADWSVEEALELLSAFLEIKHVIVHRVDGDRELWYAYSRGDIVERLRGREHSRVVDALDLREREATPAVPADGVHPKVRAVVLEDGRIAGIADVRMSGDGGTRGDRALRGDPLDADATAAGRGLLAEAPPFLKLGTTKSLLVKLTAAGAGGAATPVPSLAGDDLDVVLQATGAIQLVGESEGTFTTISDNEMVLRFKIKGSEVGEGRVTVLAFKGTTNVGRVSVTTVVTAAAPPLEPMLERWSELRAFEIPPDLTLEIYEDKRKHSYTIRLTTGNSALGYNRRKFGPIKLAADIDKYFSAFYREIEEISNSWGSALEKAGQLARRGAALFERIVPADLQPCLWALRDNIRSIQIQSEEPWIPWELCRLTGEDETGKIVNGPCISEQYEVTRWFPGLAQHRALTLRSIGLVAPIDSNMAAWQAERTEILALADQKRTVTEIKCHAIDLCRALASGAYDAVHFVGHGEFDTTDTDRSSLRLERQRKFIPDDLAGEVGNLRARRPIVFLNACEVGRLGIGLGGVAGWPQAFIKAGAGAFIGPLWRVGDGSAAHFSREFYQQLLAGATIGQAVHRARGEIRKASDPTWLAYIAYAHPNASVT